MSIVWRRIRKILAPQMDIPFARDEINRYLPWFIGLMVFLTGLFLAGGVTVGEISRHKRSDAAGWLTIQILHEDENENPQNLSSTVLVALKNHPDLQEIQQKTKDEVAQMVSPWFGSSSHASNLPLPTLIEARWRKGAKTDTEGLRKTLQALSPQVLVDDHQQWLEHYLRFIHSTELAAYLLALLVIIATAFMVVFTSRTALKLHEDAVWLLHSVGAMDEYIIRQFQFNAFLLGMRGALAGTALAAIVFFAAGFLTAQFKAPLLPSLPITATHLLIWILLPLVTGVVSMLAARKAVQSILGRMA
jgi:cell division transport system permease protein